MPQIDERIRDSRQRTPTGNITIALDADKTIHYQHITYPVTWTGFVAGERVEIVQLDSSSSFMHDYEFRLFPERFDDVKSDVKDLIDNYLHRMLD